MTVSDHEILSSGVVRRGGLPVMWRNFPFSLLADDWVESLVSVGLEMIGAWA